MICPLCSAGARSVGEFPCIGGFRTGLYRCSGCRSLFRHPMPGDEQLAEYYVRGGLRPSRGALAVRRRKARRQAEVIERWLGEAGAAKHEPIADLGAGVGALVCSLRERGFTSVVGVEPQGSSVECARRCFGVELVQDWIALAHLHVVVAPRAVLLSHVLKHLPDPSALAGYLAERFPGVLVWLEVPDGDFESIEVDDKLAWRPWLPEHLWSFTEGGLRAFFRRQGMEALKLRKLVNDRSLARLRRSDLRLAVDFALAAARMAHTGPSYADLARLEQKTTRYALLKLWARLVHVLRPQSIPDGPFTMQMLVRTVRTEWLAGVRGVARPSRAAPDAA